MGTICRLSAEGNLESHGGETYHIIVEVHGQKSGSVKGTKGEEAPIEGKEGPVVM